METIREAYGENNDSVLFVKIAGPNDDVYAVYLYNSKTKHSLANYYHVLAKNASKETRQAVLDEGMDFFKVACNFMGLEVPADEEG